jgi:5-methylcytosine-specific restriction endonuclease McrA
MNSRLAACVVCGASLEPGDKHVRLYCSNRCKVRAWKQRQSASVCGRCGVDTSYRRQFCLSCVRISMRSKPRKSLAARSCEVCATLFHVRSGRANWTCSAACSRHMRAAQWRGRKAATSERACSQCGGVFIAVSAKKCRRCQRRYNHRHRHSSGTHCQRAKRLGLPRDYSITSDKVFQRDGWRCQLCGRATPKRLKGKQQPTSPEVDHIVPLSRGGGHVWDNVQCACRQCNGDKGANVLGQLRIPMVTSVKQMTVGPQNVYRNHVGTVDPSLARNMPSDRLRQGD